MSDAVVVGAGPNGLTAAVYLAQRGLSVHVIEAADTIGGGTRTKELTLPGFRHDVCAAVHPFGNGSPALTSLPLADHGLRWRYSDVEAAHPLDGGDAVLQYADVERTAAGLGADADRYRDTIGGWAERADDIFAFTLGPLIGIPRHPLLMAGFGRHALGSAARFVGGFQTERAKALFGGHAAHNTTPLTVPGSAAVGMALMMTAHAYRWPVAEGGSAAITDALASMLQSLGGTIETGWRIESADDLPDARATLLSVTPPALLRIYGDRLGERRRLARWRFGPGVFKLDLALDGPIPWANPDVGKAITVHVGGTFDQMAASEQTMWDGGHLDRPYVLLAQPTVADPTRAPDGHHVVWAYCHVPAGSTVDRTDAIVGQIERFAPGFRDRIVGSHAMGPADFAAYNENYVGGDIIGGAFTLPQILARPKAFRPHTTSIPGVFLCGSSTAPGAGIHGMGGYWAAQAALKHLGA